MPNTFFGLTIGKSGLYASSSGINVTAHNISNAETKGYTRQQATLAASKALYVGGTNGMIGTGVDVVSVDQIRDEYYDVKYRTNNTILGDYSTKEYYLTEIENFFNEIKLEGFTTTFDDMYNTIQELQKKPTDLSVRTQMTNYAQALCEYFNYVSSNLKNIQKEINYEVSNQVDRINSIGVQMAQLTKQINSLEVLGGKASDLRDQRELLVDELSQIVDVAVTEIPVGQEVGINSYTVRINGQLLVDTYHSNELVCVPREQKTTMNDADGLYDIIWKQDKQVFNASTSTNIGSLQALYAVMEGNDNQAFKGMAEGAVGDTSITLVSDFVYINEVQRLNLDTTGKLTIGNREYTYNGFKVSQNDDGKFEYEFQLDSPLVIGTDEISPATEAVSGFQYNTIIGQDINYKGIPYYMAQLNEFVRVFSKNFNDICKSGMDLNGDAGLDFFNSTQIVTGENYRFVDNFSEYGEDENVLFTSKTGVYEIKNDYNNFGSYYFMTAADISITRDIVADSRKVVAATSIVNGTEQSDIAEKLIKLKQDTTMFRQGAPAQYLQTLVSEVGIDCNKARQFAKNQQDIIDTVTNQRLSVSGVDNDEEGMSLIRYQNCYNLSAKVISVMDEIYSKLINEMGV